MTVIHPQDPFIFADTAEKTIIIKNIFQLNSHYHRFIILGGSHFVKYDLFLTTFIEYLSLLPKDFVAADILYLLK